VDDTYGDHEAVHFEEDEDGARETTSVLPLFAASYLGR
jgi:hypothetical protein